MPSGRSRCPVPSSARARASSVRRNRRLWDRQSRAYDRRHAAALGGRNALAWGLWRVPESKARLLGPVRGRRILELGCGAARWSIALRRRGARAIGLDLSMAQLGRAGELGRSARVTLPLVRASAERLPFADGSFDIAFSDWGASTFADPRHMVPECARVLRGGGRLVLVTGNPWSAVVIDPRSGQFRHRLSRPYFGLHRLDDSPKEPVEYRLSYAGWFALFRRNGFEVERLEETRPAPRARSSYLNRAGHRFARSWPIETIWSVRKRPPARRGGSRSRAPSPPKGSVRGRGTR